MFNATFGLDFASRHFAFAARAGQVCRAAGPPGRRRAPHRKGRPRAPLPPFPAGEQKLEMFRQGLDAEGESGRHARAFLDEHARHEQNSRH